MSKKNITERIEEEISSGKHQTLSDAIDSQVEIYPSKKQEFYFAVFDLNSDPGGDSWEKVYKKIITHTSEFELLGKLGGEIEKWGDKMVYFMSKERAESLREKINIFER